MSALPKFNFEEAPELPGADRFARVFTAGVRRLVGRLWDLNIEGLDNVPRTGPAILTPNHLSFCDSVFIPVSLHRRVWAVGKGEYMDDWKTKHFFPAMGMIPVDRSGGDAAQAALDTAARVLSANKLFMIYPEGTRSRSQNLHKGRTGAARLAARCNAPVIPVGHIGTLEVQPPDTFTMKTGLPVTVRFGEPMHITDWGNPESDPRIYRKFTDAIMFEISKLSGQTYVNSYAGKDDKPGIVTGQPAAISVPTIEVERPPVSVPPGRIARPVATAASK